MDEQNRNSAARPSVSGWKRWGRAAGTVAVVAAAAGFLGAGTASAHEEPPAPAAGPVDAVGAVNTSVGVFMHHLETYHLKDPTWEVKSLLTNPKGNLEIHHEMLDGMLAPLINLVPGDGA